MECWNIVLHSSLENNSFPTESSRDSIIPLSFLIKLLNDSNSKLLFLDGRLLLYYLSLSGGNSF